MAGFSPILHFGHLGSTHVYVYVYVYMYVCMCICVCVYVYVYVKYQCFVYTPF